MKKSIAAVALVCVLAIFLTGVPVLPFNGLVAAPDTGSKTMTGTGTAEPTKALWVFGGSVVPNPVSDSTGRSNLISRSSSADVNRLFVSVYQSTVNTSGRRMYEDADMAALIAAAHAAGQEVWAAYGAPDWPTFGCTAGDFPVQRMDEVEAYNASRPVNERFDGVMLDVEPDPTTQAGFQALLDHYKCMRTSLPGSIKLGAAINAFWDDDPVTYPASGGFVKMASEHIIDLIELDSVVVMGYRDTAGTDTCPTSDGIICLDKSEIDYATSINRPGLVLAGLETINPASAGLLDKETLYEEGQIALDAESANVTSYFSATNGFGGFAIHNYSAAYLGGTPGWPTAPTSARAFLNGRIRTSSGRGIAGVLVSVSNQNGELLQVARSTSFGYYTIRDLPVGEPYVVTVRAKRFTFGRPSLVIMVNDDLDGIDFIAD